MTNVLIGIAIGAVVLVTPLGEKEISLGNNTTVPQISIHQEKVFVGEQNVDTIEEQSNVEKPEKTEKAEKVKTNRWNIKLTKSEKDLLAKIVWLEAGNQSDRGQQAVIEVIFNRIYADDYFPNTLRGVLSQYNQFSTWKNRNYAKPTEKEYQNIQKVLDGDTKVLSYRYVYFKTNSGHKRGNDCVKIGDHYFTKY